MNKTYLEFLESKVVTAEHRGIEVPRDAVHPSSKPHQADATLWALRNGQALLAMSYGLGKTHIQIDIARILIERYPGDKFLVVCPLGVKHQFVDMDGLRMGVDFQYVRTDAEIETCKSPFLITNYERVRNENIDPRKHSLIGCSLDEGSVLRNLGTKTSEKFAVVFKDVPFKFVATATPAPNQYREMIYYARYLGIMDSGQALTRWFKRDPAKAGNLQLHPQHEESFWLWVASWALFIHRPSDLDYDDEGYDLPEIEIIWHRLKTDHRNAFEHTDNRGQHRLFMMTTDGVSERAREARHTLPVRIEKMQEILDASDYGTHWLIWHHLEDERKAIQKAVPEVTAVYGSLSLEKKEKRIIDIQSGHVRIAALKPQMSGSGCNFQYHCHNALYLGVNYKFEQFIQSLHRIWRFLQGEKVYIHIVYCESEDNVVEALKAKWKRHDELAAKMQRIVKEYGLSSEALQGGLKRTIGVTRQMEKKLGTYHAVNNDCVEEIKAVKSDSVGMILTSIPFGNHYEYTTNLEDFGHNVRNEDFFIQMDFLIPEMLRVLKPGRVAAIHVKDRVMYAHQNKSGFMEINPFSDQTVLAFRKHGFMYQGRRTIVTDVVRENGSTYRLGWTEMTKDTSKMGSGLPEYLLLFRKPPTSTQTARADEPVTKLKEDYTRARWQIDAHSYWRSSGDSLVMIRQDDSEQGAPYDHEAHVGRLEAKDEKGHLPASFFSEPPTSDNDFVGTGTNFMRCLNTEQSRRNKRNHICPLPFDIVERAIRLYSNEDDIILDMFAGLFTVPYMAIKMNREGWGFELNAEYYEAGVRYCRLAEKERNAPTLFDWAVEQGMDLGVEVPR